MAKAAKRRTGSPGATGARKRGAVGGRDRGRWLGVAGVIGAVAFAVALFAAGRGHLVRDEPTRRAVVLDQLSLTAPNEAFVDRVRGLLTGAGYAVDYFAGEQVRVGLLKDLPLRGDELILLRVHSARIEAAGGKTDDVALFTGEMIDLGRYTVFRVLPAAATAVAQAIRRRSTTGGAAAPEPSHTPAESFNLIPVFYDPASGELPFFGVRPTLSRTWPAASRAPRWC